MGWKIYLPTLLVFARSHGRNLGVNRYLPFERSFGRRLDHPRLNLGERSSVWGVRQRHIPRRNSCLVLPNEQSTQPKSGPKVSVGCLISSAARPSNLSPCLRASTTNSFSGIDGEGGLISDGGCSHTAHSVIDDRQRLKNGSLDHSQPPRLPCKRLHLKQLPSPAQRRPDSPQRGRV